MHTLPECFYRVSVKALVLNPAKDKFLIMQEENGWWELPGGGLDWGELPQKDLAREIEEEMGLHLTCVAKNPSYFLTFENKETDAWIANSIYETKLESLDFVPSTECTAVKFVDKNDVEGLQLNKNILQLLEMFDKNLHLKD